MRSRRGAGQGRDSGRHLSTRLAATPCRWVSAGRQTTAPMTSMLSCALRVDSIPPPFLVNLALLSFKEQHGPLARQLSSACEKLDIGTLVLFSDSRVSPAPPATSGCTTRARGLGLGPDPLATVTCTHLYTHTHTHTQAHSFIHSLIHSPKRGRCHSSRFLEDAPTTGANLLGVHHSTRERSRSRSRSASYYHTHTHTHTHKLTRSLTHSLTTPSAGVATAAAFWRTLPPPVPTASGCATARARGLDPDPSPPATALGASVVTAAATSWIPPAPSAAARASGLGPDRDRDPDRASSAAVGGATVHASGQNPGPDPDRGPVLLLLPLSRGTATLRT